MLGALTALHPVFYFSYIALYKRMEKEKPFNKFSTSEEAINGMDLTGKLAIVTGCNIGLGKKTVEIMYAQGCNIVMACRNLDKANAARTDIMDSTEASTGTIQVMKLDLSSLQSVRDFSEAFCKEAGSLDYLILNAGIMAVKPFTPSTDGYELQFATNHVGHQYLTQLLTPKLIQSKTRVISLSSLAHGWVSKEAFDDFLEYGIQNQDGPREDNYDPLINYGITKCCNVLFAREMHRRLGDKGVITVSAHPGVIEETNLFNDDSLPKDSPLFWKFVWASFDPQFKESEIKNLSEGAATTLRCVSMNNDEIKGGHYYQNCVSGTDLGMLQGAGKEYVYKDWEKDSREAKLWSLTETLIKKKGFSLEL